MTGDDYCGKLRARYFELEQELWRGAAPNQYRALQNALKEVELKLQQCGGLSGTQQPQPQQPQAQQPAAIKSSSPGQATPVPPTSYVGQGSQKQQPAFGMAAAQKKPPAFGGAGFNRY